MLKEKVRYAPHCPVKYRNLMKKMLNKDAKERISSFDLLNQFSVERGLSIGRQEADGGIHVSKIP